MNVDHIVALRVMVRSGQLADDRGHPFAIGPCDCHPDTGREHWVAMGPGTVWPCHREVPLDVGLCISDCPACAELGTFGPGWQR